MKKVLITLVVVVVTLNLTAQKIHTVAWYNWSDPIAFQLSPSPLITGYGYYSDSFSNDNNGVQYYEYAGEYYPIRSWADYYLWYVNKYWFHFIDADLYEYYYWTNNDFEMARYIASKKYKCRYYPSRIYISFGIKYVYINRLYVNSPYIASNSKQVRQLNSLIGYKKVTHKNYHKPTNKPVIVKRGVHRSKGNAHKPNRSNRINSYVVNKDRRKENNDHQKYSRHNNTYNNSGRNTTNTEGRSSSNVRNNSGRNLNQKINTKEVKQNKYEHKTSNRTYSNSSRSQTNFVNRSSNVNNNSRGNRNNSINRSSSGKNNSSKTKSSKRK